MEWDMHYENDFKKTVTQSRTLLSDNSNVLYSAVQHNSTWLNMVNIPELQHIVTCKALLCKMTK